MTGRPPTREVLARAVDGLERLEFLDGIAAPIRRGAKRLLRSDRIVDLASGTPLGHPVHPVLVQLPIGFWTSAMVLDFTGRGQRRGARWLTGLGVLSALPAIASGVSDWSNTDLAESRVGLVHAALNDVAVGCFAMSWWTRRRGGRTGQGWSLAGATVATGAGWLGGHLAYNMGVGVDTNAFEVGPADWTKVSGEIDPNGGVSGGTVDGVGVVAVQTGGSARVLAGRCSHRGGPLPEGHRQGNCVVCPWHGSQFDLDSGVPAKGPASVPQPVYEARIVDGDLEVRRREPRALRQRVMRPGRDD
ncbi:MAG TPA: DUF2231 domain-containing protein [Acidimicrobiales bacterium]|jgi:nitrite reductase/ring-hydroxylating ferredoxin subunit/uncharacterized membrane protein|nr:DUF2231 domain-containing protein [Acidimicrobiales bacterium]